MYNVKPNISSIGSSRVPTNQPRTPNPAPLPHLSHTREPLGNLQLPAQIIPIIPYILLFPSFLSFNFVIHLFHCSLSPSFILVSLLFSFHCSLFIFTSLCSLHLYYSLLLILSLSNASFY